MKKIIILFGILYFKTFSQSVNPTDIFDNIQPIWAHLAFDSSVIGGTYNGMNHLFGFAGYNSPLVVGDNAYIVYHDAGNLFQGSLIEKIDIQSGNRVWMNSYNLHNSTKRAYTSYSYINDQNEIVLLDFRSIENKIFIVWTASKLSVRKYDINDGSLLDFEFTEATDSSSPEIFNYCNQTNSNLTQLYPNKDTGYEFIFTHFDSSNCLLQRHLFNSKRSQYYQDEISQPFKFPFFTYKIPFPYNSKRDTLIMLRQSQKTMPFMPGDSMELIIDMYDKSMNNFISYDITNKIKKASDYNINKVEDGYIYISSYGFQNTEPYTERFSIFDVNCNLIEELTMPKVSVINSNCLKLKDQKGFLIVRSLFTDASKMSGKIQFFISDGNGNLQLTKELLLKDNQALRFNQLYQTADRDIILFGDYKGGGGGTFSPTSGRSIIAKFSAKDIGIITANKEVDKNSSIDIYPNPVDDGIIIESKDINFSKLQIQDLCEKVISTQICNNQGNLFVLNMNEFGNGVYILLGFGLKNEILFRKKIVVQH